MDPSSPKRQRVEESGYDVIETEPSQTSQPIEKEEIGDQTEILVPFDDKKKGVASDTHENGPARRWACFLCRSVQLKRLPACEHCICDDCIMPFITDMMRECLPGFKCPKFRCSNMWTMQQCLDYVPREVRDRCMQAMHETRTLAHPQYITCPFHRCGATIIDDMRGFRIRACTRCWGVFCTDCRVDWHMGMSCSEYQTLAQSADEYWSLLG